jgi:serine/threonine-protein kinase
VPPDGVHQHLEKILASRAFAGANRHKDFLKYVVCRFLEGKNGDLKEYSIALDVFGRQPSFDPKIDPIVRVEACRLRSRLNEYQNKEAKDDSLVIELSKRGYVPIIRRVITKRHEPTLAVLPFFDLNNTTESDALVDGLTEELIDILTDVAGVRVCPRIAVFPFKGSGAGVQVIGRELKAELLIEGSIRQMGQRILVRTRLVNVSVGLTERLAVYEGQVKNFPTMVEEIAQSIVAELKQQFLHQQSVAVQMTPVTDADALEEDVDTAPLTPAKSA